MPNWTENTLTLTGDAATLQRLLDEHEGDDAITGKRWFAEDIHED